MRISPNTHSSKPGSDGHCTSTAVGSYSELLFSEDVDGHLKGQDSGCFSFVLPDDESSRMACFGDSGEIVGLEYQKNGIMLVKKNETTCINDSPSIAIAKSKVLPMSNDKRSMGERKTSGEDGKEKKKSGNGNGAPAKKAPQRNYKRAKSGNNSSLIGHAKVKKPKLGERIIALQQLVSPFGKTDTASVLHEAKGYISFLQDQVQLLCSPYLQHLRSYSSPHHPQEGEEKEVDKSRKDLRSKGLCLVPIGIASLHITDDNGADIWSPANALVNFSC